MVEHIFPILYTCYDEEGNKYLVMCIDTDDLTYVIAKTNEDDIDKMIRVLESSFMIYLILTCQIRMFVITNDVKPLPLGVRI